MRRLRRFKSLGKSGDISKAQHCRAEVFLSGYGWVPVDPADVRKVVLEEKAGGIALTDPQAQKARGKLFGAWEMNWLAYNYAHDLKLPSSTGRPWPSSCTRRPRSATSARTASIRRPSATRSPRAS